MVLSRLSVRDGRKDFGKIIFQQKFEITYENYASSRLLLKVSYSSYHNRGITVRGRSQTFHGLWQEIPSAKLKDIYERILIKFFVSLSSIETVSAQITLKATGPDGQTRYRTLGAAKISQKAESEWFELYGNLDLNSYQPIEEWQGWARNFFSGLLSRIFCHLIF